jgi:hypothetical protein
MKVRNDARPIGEDSPASPIGGDDAVNRETDSRDRLKHGRESHIVHPRTEEEARREDRDSDATMPTGDSTLNTKI